MSYLGKNELSEKGQVLMSALFTLAAMAGTGAAIEALGLGWVWNRIHRLPGALGLLAAMAIWGGVLLAITHGARAAQIGGRLILGIARALMPSGSLSSARIAGAAGNAGAGAAASLLRGAIALMGVLPALLLGPAAEIYVLRWSRLWHRAHERTAPARAILRREWMLWRAYRGEFRAQFGSYRKFRRAFAAGAQGRADGGERTQASSAPDGLGAACKLMGLPQDGRFAEGQFKARYRALMKELHPDRGGDGEQAARINAACALIRKRKGWS